jgi:5-(carboxyamino)imidazole ribonucleotide synthase
MQKPLYPGDTQSNGQQTTLGVMGGGQLGRMFVQAAQKMGYFTAVLDPDTASPAGRVSHYHIQTAYDDEQGLAQLMQRCAAITTEFENVPAPALHTLGAHRPVAPHADSVAVAQDRSMEKAHFVNAALAAKAAGQTDTVMPAPYRVIESEADLAKVTADLLPGILKTSRMGYDGKGQVRVANAAELAAAWADLKNVPCVLEKMLPLAAECSVVVARGSDGVIVNLPVQFNIHREGILAVTEVYSDLAAGVAANTQFPTHFKKNWADVSVKSALLAAQNIANELNYIGVLCVEFFILEDASLVVNEMAPRPHNSGHYSMDACSVSQFDLQVYALCGLPLPQPRLHSAAVMVNLLGDVWFDAAGKERTPAWGEVLALPGTHLHLYGKLSARKGRKMGHLNVVGADAAAVRATALQAAALLGISGW